MASLYSVESSGNDDDDLLSGAQREYTVEHAGDLEINSNINPHELKRKDFVQTALDLVVEAGGTTVGDILLASIPSEPTTVSLPGYGALTLGSVIPAKATPPIGRTDIAASPATATSSPVPISFSSSLISSSIPSAAMTANSSLTSSTTAFNALSSGLANSTSFANSSTTATTTGFNSTTLTSMSSTTSFSTWTSFSTSSVVVSTSSAAPGPVGGGGVPQSTPTASSGAAPANNSSGNSKAGPIAGGVVGGVAGALVLGIILFLIVRRLRNNANGTRLDDGEEGAASTAPPSRGGPSGPVTQRSSFTPFAAAVNRYRQSQQSSVYTEPSERGFQRVSGRKLTPVIRSGGDGYTEPALPGPAVPPTVAHNLSRDFTAGSFYRDSAGSVFGQTPGPEDKIPGASMVTPESAAAASAAMAAHRSTLAPSSTSSMRAVPATSARNSELLTADRAADRATALRSERYFSSSPDSFDDAAAAGGAASSNPFRTPSPEVTIQQGPQRTPIVARRDGIGRSQPSQDGSRVSRFSETF